MESTDILELWKAYDKKLMASLNFNRKIVEEIQMQKIKKSISSVRYEQIAGIIFGVPFILAFGFLIFHSLDNLYFSISMGAILLFNAIAVGKSIQHLIMLSQINYDQSLLQTQGELARVQISITQIARFLILQTPFWCTFFLNDDLVKQGDIIFWIIEGGVTWAITFGSAWLYLSLAPDNLNKPWVKKMLNFLGGKSITKAIQALQEIEEYKAAPL